MDSHAIALALGVIVRLYGAEIVEPDALQRAEMAARATFERGGTAIEWRGCADGVAGQHAESSAIARHGVLERDLHRKVSNQSFKRIQLRPCSARGLIA